MKGILFLLRIWLFGFACILLWSSCKKEYSLSSTEVQVTCDTSGLAIIHGCRPTSFRNYQHDSGSNANYFEGLIGFGYDSLNRYAGWGKSLPKWWEGTYCTYDKCNNYIVKIEEKYQGQFTQGYANVWEIEYNKGHANSVKYYEFSGNPSVKILKSIEEISAYSSSYVLSTTRSDKNEWLQTHARYYNGAGDVSSEAFIYPDRSFTVYYTYDTTAFNPRYLIPEYNLLMKESVHYAIAGGDSPGLPNADWLINGSLEKNSHGYVTRVIWYSTDEKGVRKENGYTYNFSNCP